MLFFVLFFSSEISHDPFYSILLPLTLLQSRSDQKSYVFDYNSQIRAAYCHLSGSPKEPSGNRKRVWPKTQRSSHVEMGAAAADALAATDADVDADADVVPSADPQRSDAQRQ